MTRLRSERLILRPWEERDRDFWAALNADPEVMRFFEKVRNRAESDRVFARLEAHFVRHGFGFWVLERRLDGEAVGFTGLQHVDRALPFAPAVEIGWRLKRSAWGEGYASEAARACLAYAFDVLRLEKVVSFAVPANEASLAVMRRIGMQRAPELDFDHPFLPRNSPLRRHITWLISAEEWRRAGAAGGP
ncbi:GNAT family N-acetyltransferase [Afifella pfennigii]|uniref:GNAT family N-acetyltransferase n=1 Tax=Afifella pfennigii TaxID=209897 RepID=UPI0005563906|nr:GNAT family N-acetyltransferase [Afifella pfennigii]